MDINNIQDIVTLLNGCYGTRVRLIQVETSNIPFNPSFATGVGVHTYYNTSHIVTTINFTMDIPTELPLCMQSYITSMSTMYNTSGDNTADCTMIIHDLAIFSKQLRKELWEIYSEKFDSFMDKLLSEEVEN